MFISIKWLSLCNISKRLHFYIQNCEYRNTPNLWVSLFNRIQKYFEEQIKKDLIQIQRGATEAIEITVFICSFSTMIN